MTEHEETTVADAEDVDALRQTGEVMGDAERWPQDPRTPFGRFAMFLTASKWWDPNMLLGSSYGGRAEIVVSVGDLRAIFDELREARAGQPPLFDEYGMRITYISTRTLEGALSDNADNARARIAELAEEHHRSDVVSRELIHRKVTRWKRVEQEGDRG